MPQEEDNKRLLIVSNRLPVALEEDETGSWYAKPGSGGLVTALAPVLQNRGGLWIGWPGTAEKEGVDFDALLGEATMGSGYTFKTVPLDEKEVQGYYYGFANEILWPLFHDLQTRCNFDPEYWQMYRRVNRKFSQIIAGNMGEDDHIWIHDYHLMGVGAELRQIGCSADIGFFLHTPFPSFDLFTKLPWRFQILNALLAYDLVGFQTQRDRRNFVQCVETMLKDVQISGSGQVLTAQTENRDIRIGNFPISIDYHEFVEKAETKEVVKRSEELRENLDTECIVLGVDRLDYTKGIPERLAAFRNALERYPELRTKLTLVQVVVPSRTSIPRYNDLKEEIEQLVSEINGRFTQPGWVPIHFLFRSLERTELLAYYQASDIALITPLKDGMNLIAKEYCASNVKEEGVLILSEFAGAADQMYNDALLVNPYDIESVADAIHYAATMEMEEKRGRMRTLRNSVREYDIFWWVESFMKAVFAHDLNAFPALTEYIPTEKAETIWAYRFENGG